MRSCPTLASGLLFIGMGLFSPGAAVGLTLGLSGAGSFSAHVNVTVAEESTGTFLRPIQESVLFLDHGDATRTTATYDPVGILVPSASVTELTLAWEPLEFFASVGTNAFPMTLMIDELSWSFGGDPIGVVPLGGGTGAAVPSAIDTMSVALRGSLAFLGETFPFDVSSDFLCGICTSPARPGLKGRPDPAIYWTEGSPYLPNNEEGTEASTQFRLTRYTQGVTINFTLSASGLGGLTYGTPVPEPSGAVLLAIGACGLLFRHPRVTS